MCVFPLNVVGFNAIQLALAKYKLVFCGTNQLVVLIYIWMVKILSFWNQHKLWLKTHNLYQLGWILNVDIAWQGHDAASSSGAQGATDPDACRPASGSNVIKLS